MAGREKVAVAPLARADSAWPSPARSAAGGPSNQRRPRPGRRRRAGLAWCCSPSLLRMAIGLSIGVVTLLAGAGSASLGASPAAWRGSVTAEAALLAEEAGPATVARMADPGGAYAPSVERWRGLADRVGAQEGVAPTLLLCVMSRESAGDPAALSRAGALGLMQVMPGTFQQVLPGGDPLAPEDSVRAGARYLRRSLNSHRSLLWAIAGYNAGIEATTQLRQTVGYVPAWWRDGEPFDYMQDVSRCAARHAVPVD